MIGSLLRSNSRLVGVGGAGHCRGGMLVAGGSWFNEQMFGGSSGRRSLGTYADDDAPSAADVAGLQENFKANPDAAKVSFAATGAVTSGLRSVVDIRSKFNVPFDEPAALGGTDTAPNPVEGVLAALATCQEITYKAYARAGELHLEKLNSTFEGDIDLRGFFAVSDEARAGFHNITGDVQVSAQGLDAQGMQGLKEAVDSHCPVLDTLLHPVQVNIGLKYTKVDSGLENDDAPSADDIAGLQDMFKKDTKAAQAKFQVSSSLTSGLRSTATVRDKFSFPTDEPESLGGKDSAPNPVELLLASLASCQEITYKAYARAMGIELRKVSCSVRGHIDLRGFFAVAPYEEARPGFYKIDGTVTLESTASEEAIAQLKQVVDAHCPVLDMMQAAVPTTVATKIGN